MQAPDPAESRFELRPIRCPTCDLSAETVLGYRGGKYHRYGLGIPSRIVQCRQCGLVYPNPFPFARKPEELYADPDKYFNETSPDQLVAATRETVRHLVELLGRRDGLTLLDVGAGRGAMLRAAQLESVAATGIEFSQAMIDRARELFDVPVLNQRIETLAETWTGPPFDAVTLAAILEHVYDPSAFMASVRKLTRVGSVVYIDVPREPNLMTMVGNLVNRLRGAKAIYNLQPTWSPYHVFGFNEKALSALLRKHGFEILELSVWAAPKISAKDEWRDRLKAFVATQINRVANATGTAANMSAFAKRVS